MSAQSARLALPFLLPAQAQKHVTHNEALERLDLIVQIGVEGFGSTTPPANPQEGQIWALGPGPVGDWAGQGGRLAARTGNGWQFITPGTGWIACAGRDLRVFAGNVWVHPDPGALQNLPGLGVNTSSDMTNRLAVTAPATLLSHEGAGHQLKINKASATDTASLLFQTGWSGRAEIGSAGSDDFAIKVSADGVNWQSALVADKDDGVVKCLAGMLIDEQLAFHRGNILGTVSHSGGIPTGAILQRGSNSNGQFVRFADGTQICWTNFGDYLTHAFKRGEVEVSSPGASLAYPAAFSHMPRIQWEIDPDLPAQSYAFAVRPAGHTEPLTQTSNYRIIAARDWTDPADRPRARAIATGRWF